MECALCGRRADKEYCSLHQRAFENIVKSYEYWRDAASTSWVEYLKELEDNSSSGTWVVEVCRHLLSKNENDEINKKE